MFYCKKIIMCEPFSHLTICTFLICTVNVGVFEKCIPFKPSYGVSCWKWWIQTVMRTKKCKREFLSFFFHEPFIYTKYKILSKCHKSSVDTGSKKSTPSHKHQTTSFPSLAFIIYTHTHTDVPSVDVRTSTRVSSHVNTQTFPYTDI